MTQLSLMEPTPTPAQLSTRKDRWMRQLRAAVRRRHKGETITTDEVWSLMHAEPTLRVPDGMSANVLGSFFSDWPLATKTGDYRRSERPGSHGNLLTLWYVS